MDAALQKTVQSVIDLRNSCADSPGNMELQKSSASSVRVSVVEAYHLSEKIAAEALDSLMVHDLQNEHGKAADAHEGKDPADWVHRRDAIFSQACTALASAICSCRLQSYVSCQRLFCTN